MLSDISEDIVKGAFCARIYQGYFVPKNNDAVYKPIDFFMRVHIYLKIQS